MVPERNLDSTDTPLVPPSLTRCGLYPTPGEPPIRLLHLGESDAYIFVILLLVHLVDFYWWHIATDSCHSYISDEFYNFEVSWFCHSTYLRFADVISHCCHLHILAAFCYFFCRLEYNSYSRKYTARYTIIFNCLIQQWIFSCITPSFSTAIKSFILCATIKSITFSTTVKSILFSATITSLIQYYSKSIIFSATIEAIYSVPQLKHYILYHNWNIILSAILTSHLFSTTIQSIKFSARI